LVPIYRAKFMKHRSTVDLIRESVTAEERDPVAIVALLDIEDSLVVDALVSRAQGENCHIFSCRDMLKHQLEMLARGQEVTSR
jgi:hypothetical protein